MDKILSDISSTSWWVGVIIVGVMVNLISSFLSRKMDSLHTIVSRWRVNRSESLKKEHQMKVNELAGNSSRQILVAIEESNLRMKAIYKLLLAVVVTGFAFMNIYIMPLFVTPNIVDRIFTITFFVLALLLFFSHMVYSQNADKLRYILFEVKLRDKDGGSSNK